MKQYPSSNIDSKITFCKDCCNFIKFEDKVKLCPKAEKAIKQAIKHAIDAESVFDLFQDDKKSNAHYVRIAQLLFHMFRGCPKFENLDFISQTIKDLAEYAAIAEVYKRITKEKPQCKN